MNDEYYLIEKAIHYIEQNFKNQPDLEEIAQAVHVSPFHFQKMFTKWAGISPKKFLQFLTLEYTKSRLNIGADHDQRLLDLTYDVGLSSPSRLHDLFLKIDAITPAEYKKLGKDLVITYGFHQTQFGLCLIALTDRGICGLYFGDNRENLLENLYLDWPNAGYVEDSTKTESYIQQIFSRNQEIEQSINFKVQSTHPSAYGHFPQGKEIPNSLNPKMPVLLKGTNFQIQVWKALLQIPEGTLRTYENIAAEIGSPKAARAVGSAIGANKISYLIPCHRVINKLGVVGHYRWGSARKKAMIGWEAAHSASPRNDKLACLSADRE